MNYKKIVDELEACPSVRRKSYLKRRLGDLGVKVYWSLLELKDYQQVADVYGLSVEETKDVLARGIRRLQNRDKEWNS